MVNQKGIKIRDRAARREYQLQVGKQDVHTGDYEIDVQELPAGVEFATTKFTLKRGDKVTAVATFKRTDDVGFLREGLCWFPAQATFFGGRDMHVFPELSVQQLLVLTQLAGRIDPRNREELEFLSLVGRIDRITFAYLPDRDQPDRSRIFIRATGSINHQRLVEWLRERWPGATLREETGSQGEPITLAGSLLGIAPAFALIGKTDLILAAYQGRGNHLEVVQQVLELRAGRGASLPGPWADDLQKTPANAWAFMVGEPPEVFKNLPPFHVLPRRVVFSVSGTKNLEAHFHGRFATTKDAKAFVDQATRLKQQGRDFLKNPPVKINPRSADLLAASIGNVRMEAAGGDVQGEVRLSIDAVDALIDAIHDLPFSLFHKLIGPAPRNGDQEKSKP